MGKLIVWNVMTIDGQFEGGPWDLAHHETIWNEQVEKFSLEQLDSMALLVFGRKTYVGMASYWTTVTGEEEVAKRMNAIPKAVFSNTLTSADWANTRLITEEATLAIPRLKSETSGDIYIFGSAELAGCLFAAGLVDEYRIGLAPIVLGKGSPLFKRADRSVAMDLLEARVLDNGALILRYAPRPQG